jgi:hypothetical protein
LNPWKEIVVTAHDLLDEAVGHLAKPVPLVVRVASLLQDFKAQGDLLQHTKGSLLLANQQLERQAKTIAELQPKPEPPSEAPPPVTVAQYNDAVIKEVERRRTVRRRKRRDEGI